jgi:tetratricopeptide (TPR) repeat protein
MNADDLYHLGRVAMEAGHLEEAVALFQESISEWPHVKTMELEGECLLRLGRAREAIVPLAAATALNPSAHPPGLLAHAFLALGHYREALEFADEALRRAPADPLALEARLSARSHLASRLDTPALQPVVQCHRSSGRYPTSSRFHHAPVRERSAAVVNR